MNDDIQLHIHIIIKYDNVILFVNSNDGIVSSQEYSIIVFIEYIVICFVILHFL